MGKGTKAQFTCPHALDIENGNEVNEDQKVLTELHKQSDVSYEVEVVECSAKPIRPPEPVAEPIQPNRCIFIVGASIDGTESMALTVKEEDKYAYTGNNWGIYDVFVDKWDGVGTSNKNQRW